MSELSNELSSEGGENMKIACFYVGRERLNPSILLPMLIPFGADEIPYYLFCGWMKTQSWIPQGFANWIQPDIADGRLIELVTGTDFKTIAEMMYEAGFFNIF